MFQWNGAQLTNKAAFPFAAGRDAETERYGINPANMVMLALCDRMAVDCLSEV
jgi:hypothetical protein